MKININGVTRPMTETEEKAYNAELERMQALMPPPEPTPEERLAAVERENAYLREALELLLSGETNNEEVGA